MSQPVNYRPAQPADIPFILDSWMKSWRNSPWAGTIPNNRYFETQRDCIEQLIARGMEVIVATHEPTGRILGYIAYEQTQDTPARTVVHYLYVKDAYLRVRPSIAEALLERTPGAKPGYFSHRYRTVSDTCRSDAGWRHAAEIARRAYRPDKRKPSKAPVSPLPQAD